MIGAGYEDGIRQFSAQRSDVQDGARSDAVGSRTVLAVDDLAVGEFAWTLARSCAWAARWSTSIAGRSPRFPNGSRSTSTTRSMRCTAASNCGCSTPTTMSTDFNPSWCSTARDASSPPCFVPPSGRAAPRSSPSCAGSCARSALTGPHRDPVARRQPLLRSRGSRLVRRERPRLRPRRRADPDVASPCGRSRSQHEGAVRGRARGRQAPPLQVGEEGPDTRFVVTNLKNATLACSTKTSIAGAATPKTTSNPSRPIWRRTSRPARRRPPTSSVSSSTPAPTGDVGPSERRRSARCGASPSSTPCACASSRSPPASSK